MKKPTLIEILILIALIAIVFWYLRKESRLVNIGFEKYNKQVEYSDSLQNVINQVRKVNDSLRFVSRKSDSLATTKLDSVRKKFNDNEKNNRIRVLDNLDDSSKQSFFSEWITE